ncbi:hypothetical protein OUZ56_022178 [Daphnia magna]|uniref:Uncharacterized protein n=1 Tax=Daphnia magna TaxID=35525 RepID=A0ABR0AVP8_9CRUS|nr:hypothetical protein OUZ56_022178 [Daphnia magna]
MTDRQKANQQQQPSREKDESIETYVSDTIIAVFGMLPRERKDQRPFLTPGIDAIRYEYKRSADCFSRDGPQEPLQIEWR